MPEHIKRQSLRRFSSFIFFSIHCSVNKSANTDEEFRGINTVLTLPEGQEDDGLDRTELPDGFIRAEQFPSGEVEQEQGVQCQTDRDVVDDGDVKVTAVCPVWGKNKLYT